MLKMQSVLNIRHIDRPVLKKEEKRKKKSLKLISDNKICLFLPSPSLSPYLKKIFKEAFERLTSFFSQLHPNLVCVYVFEGD